MMACIEESKKKKIRMCMLRQWYKTTKVQYISTLAIEGSLQNQIPVQPV